MVTGIFFFPPPLTNVEPNHLTLTLTFSHLTLTLTLTLTIHIYFLHLTILMLLPHQKNTCILELPLPPLHPPFANPPFAKVEPNLLNPPFGKVEPNLLNPYLIPHLTLLTLLTLLRSVNLRLLLHLTLLHFSISIFFYPPFKKVEPNL